MPYQGADYQAPDYSNYGHRAFPNGQAMGQSRQVQGGHQYSQQRNGQAPYSAQSAARQPAPPAGSAYGLPVNYSQTAYSTPQYYDQSQSYYQAPASNFQYSQQYLSPPSQSAQIPQQQYSPDQLQRHQVPPQPYRGTVNQPHFDQRSPNQQHRQPPTQQQRPPQYQTPHAQAQVAQWTNHQSPPQRTATSQANAASVARNRQVSQGTPSQQRPNQQRTPSSHGQGVKVERPSPALPSAPPPKQKAPVVKSEPADSALLPQRPQSTQHTQRPPSQPQHPQSSAPQSTTINPSVLQKKVARVEIPVQRPEIKVERSSPMPRSPKRRRSNDGHPIPVPACETRPTPQRHAIGVQLHKHQPQSSATASRVQSSQASTQSQPSIDYQTVLLSLSDEYINAAYSMTADLETPEVSEEQLDEYHALLSTGMGCLDAVLKHYHISDPRKEARIRLRFASLLHEETDNDMTAEEILSKGISVCQRAGLTDAKYAMHHLLARIWFKSNKSKAAMKALDKVISEVEKLNLIHWVYAFRFLHISMALQKDLSISETMTAVKHLTSLAAIADRHGHVSVMLVAAALEALIHLRSRTPESVDIAQRALTNARTHQLSNEMACMPQIKLLLDCISLGCALTHFSPAEAANMTSAMQQDIDQCTRNGTWTDDGTFLVPLCDIKSPAIELERDTGNILKVHGFGDTICALPLKWLTQNQVYALGFLLSGLGFMNSNSLDQRAEKMLSEGLGISKAINNHPPQSLSSASSHYEANRRMRILLRLYVVFAYAGRAEWGRALKGLENIHKDVDQLGSDPGTYINDLMIYLEAVCKHGLGDLEGALALYHSPTLKTVGNLDPRSTNVNPISVLAALNSVPVMRRLSGGREPEVLLNQIANYCLTHSNNNGNEYGSKTLESALYALKANEPNGPGAENTIIKTKQYLQSAVSAAKGVSNNRLLAVVMAMMSAMFFGRIVGEQAEKSAKAGRSLARKSQDKLWMAVADGMFCNTLEKCGKIAEAEEVKREAQEAMARLPKSLQTALSGHVDVMDER